MPAPENTRDEHDRVVQHVASTRFPFPDQTDWPNEYVTITNVSAKNFGISTTDGTYYPDIVIIDGRRRVQEVGEVETTLTNDAADRWRIGSDAAGPIPESGVKHFFVYVPSGREDGARRMLDEHRISYAGVRAYEMDDGGEIRIVPIVTPGHAKDHR